jgi:hypothetical protein
MSELLRRKEDLLAARKEATLLATALAEALRLAQEALAAGAAQAKTTEAARKAAAKAERTARAKATANGIPTVPDARADPTLRPVTSPVPMEIWQAQPPPPPIPSAMDQDVPFSWTSGLANDREPTPPNDALQPAPP